MEKSESSIESYIEKEREEEDEEKNYPNVGVFLGGGNYHGGTEMWNSEILRETDGILPLLLAKIITLEELRSRSCTVNHKDDP